MKLVHVGIINHKCEICCRNFFQAGNLRKHIREVHEGVKDQNFNRHDKDFVRSADLKMEINDNYETKPNSKIIDEQQTIKVECLSNEPNEQNEIMYSEIVIKEEPI